MAIKIIGKTTLGSLGFCQVPSKMGDNFGKQLEKIQKLLPTDLKIVMTSMTGSNEIEQTNGAYFPKIRVFTQSLDFFYPRIIYAYCKAGLDKYRPCSDFIIWNKDLTPVSVISFSREAPILAFESSIGKKALGVILRPSLMKYGDYLFSAIKEALGSEITVTLVTCNHFEYPEGSIPSIVQSLAEQYNMKCIIGEDS